MFYSSSEFLSCYSSNDFEETVEELVNPWRAENRNKSMYLGTIAIEKTKYIHLTVIKASMSK